MNFKYNTVYIKVKMKKMPYTIIKSIELNILSEMTISQINTIYKQ